MNGCSHQPSTVGSGSVAVCGRKGQNDCSPVGSGRWHLASAGSMPFCVEPAASRPRAPSILATHAAALRTLSRAGEARRSNFGDTVISGTVYPIHPDQRAGATITPRAIKLGVTPGYGGFLLMILPPGHQRARDLLSVLLAVSLRASRAGPSPPLPRA